jgi:hypothetical protein
LADSTHGGTGGIEHYTAIVTGGTVQIEFLWDAVKLPDTDLSIGTGDDFVAKLKCGTTDKFYQFLVITESFSVIDNETSDVIRCSLTGRINGVVTPPVT